MGTPVNRIEQIIYFIRGRRVILDSDLAGVYGVTTKALNQAVKRNHRRFPEDFMFRLNPLEDVRVRGSSIQTVEQNRSQNVTGSLKHRNPRFLPYAFTEHGAVMAANVLNSPVAVRASIQVVRAFVRLREILASNRELAQRLDALERKYDKRFRVVFDAIRELMRPEVKPGRRIGFRDL